MLQIDWEDLDYRISFTAAGGEKVYLPFLLSAKISMAVLERRSIVLELDGRDYHLHYPDIDHEKEELRVIVHRSKI